MTNQHINKRAGWVAIVLCAIVFGGGETAADSLPLNNLAPAMSSWVSLRAQCAATVPATNEGVAAATAVSGCQQIADAAYQVAVMKECIANVKSNHKATEDTVPKYMRKDAVDAVGTCQDWWRGATFFSSLMQSRYGQVGRPPR